MNGLVKFALGLARVPDDMVADIDKAIPGAQRVIAAAKALEPALARLGPLWEQAQPIVINEVLPVLKTIYPDLVALLPVAQEILAFVDDKK